MSLAGKRIETNVLAVAMVALLAGCAGQTVGPGESAPYIQSQKEQARVLRQQGKLAESLAFWRSILPANKHDQEANEAIAALKRDISKKVKRLNQQAQSAYRQGNKRGGDNYALKILALQPGNSQAVEWLVASTTEKARAQASSKTQQQYAIAKPKTQAVAAPVPAEPAPAGELESLLAAKDYAAVIARADTPDHKSNPLTAGLLRAAHVGQAEAAIATGDPLTAIENFRAGITAKPLRNDPLIARVSKIQQEASDNWYKEGRRVLNTDIDAAIVAFSKALEAKPNHPSAKSALKRAKTLKQNLEKIENR